MDSSFRCTECDLTVEQTKGKLKVQCPRNPEEGTYRVNRCKFSIRGNIFATYWVGSGGRYSVCFPERV